MIKFLTLLLVASTFLVAGQKIQTNYSNYCKEHPYAKPCIPKSLGGTDDIKKERKREKFHDHVDGYNDDRRTYPSEDLEDPRTTL